jgi:hypothetical protein
MFENIVIKLKENYILNNILFITYPKLKLLTVKNSYRDLSRHIKRHKEAFYPCDICNMPFLAHGHLNGHKENVYGIASVYEPRICKCKKCDNETKHCSDHSRHMKRHENALDSCKYCNRPFFNIENLKAI